jgi:hypothetical protein
MAISVASVGTLANHYGHFLERSTANKFRRERFANGFTLKLGLHIFQLGYGVPGERDQNIADDDASPVGGAVRLYLKHNRSRLLIALERLAKSVG